MGRPRNEEGRGVRRRVHFIIVPDDRRVTAVDGVPIPAYGVFVDQNGDIIPIVLDERDAFRVKTRGMLFSKQEAQKALGNSLIAEITNARGRQRLFSQIRNIKNFARRTRQPLERAIQGLREPGATRRAEPSAVMTA